MPVQLILRGFRHTCSFETTASIDWSKSRKVSRRTLKTFGPGLSGWLFLMKSSAMSAWNVSELCVTVKETTRSSSEVARGRSEWIALVEVAIAKRRTKGIDLVCRLLRRERFSELRESRA